MAMRLVLDLPTPLGRFGLRPERPEDAAFLYHLFATSQAFVFDALPLEGAAKDEFVRFQFHAQTRGYRATFPNAEFSIVELDQKPLGRLVVEREGDEALRFVDFVLLPERRGAGVGPTIMRALMAGARAQGRKIRVAILWHNEPSLRMCRRLGFVQVEERPPFVEMEWRPEPVPAEAGASLRKGADS
jgi:RimJ/RimL family protein N-acetyltransferase